MWAMVKLMLLGALATAIVSVTTGVTLHVVDANGEVRGIAFVLVACVAGLIGAQVADRLPTSKRPQ